MKSRMAMTCWSERSPLVRLSDRAERYLQLAEAILEAVPDAWPGVTATLTIDRQGRETSRVASTCRDMIAADASCHAAIRRAILVHVVRPALIPDQVDWVGFQIEYDIEAERLTASVTHGDPVDAAPSLFPKSY